MYYIKINKDEVSRTVHKTDKLDLRTYKDRLLSIKTILESLHVKKTKSDIVTLRAYNAFAWSVGGAYKKGRSQFGVDYLRFNNTSNWLISYRYLVFKIK